MSRRTVVASRVHWAIHSGLCRSARAVGPKSGGAWPVAMVCLLAAALVAAAPAQAQNWPDVTVIAHSYYQSITSTGSSAYPSGGFPTRLIGVVLNDNEDWLDPTAAAPVFMGGQAEIFVQAVDLTGTAWQYDGTATDFGGTAAWMGQYIGKMKNNHPDGSYTDAEWYAELDRLGYWRPGTPLDRNTPDANGQYLIRAGDLVELRARGGLNYKGKMNVNEQHYNAPDYDFEVVRLAKDYGLPAAAALSLAAFKNADDTYIFDTTRQTGGERYQSSLVKLQRVHLQSRAGWALGATLTLTDATERTLPVRLGLDPALTTLGAPDGWFHLTGIVNQEQSGTYGDPGFNAGYYLLGLRAEWFAPLEGDGDQDWDVDNTDLGTSYGNFTGPGSFGKTWSQGDSDADGDVDNSDLGLSYGNFTGPKETLGLIELGMTLEPRMANAGSGDYPNNGIADLLYHPVSGEVWLDQSQAAGGIITNFVLRDNEGGMLPANANFPFLGVFKTALATEISQTDPLASGWSAGQNPWALGAIFPSGMDAAQLAAWLDQATYVGELGSGVHSFDLHVVPEPGTAALALSLAVVAAVFGLRRRRNGA